jgi:hypothetical protein
MGVDVELQVPVTIILIPLSILFVLWWISGTSKRFFEWLTTAGEQWSEKASETHLVQEQVYKEEQVIQAGLAPYNRLDPDIMLYKEGELAVEDMPIYQGVTASGVRISQYGTYGMTETKQVIGL